MYYLATYNLDGKQATLAHQKISYNTDEKYSFI